MPESLARAVATVSAHYEIDRLKHELDQANARAAVMRQALEQRPAAVGSRGSFYAAIWEDTVKKLLVENHAANKLVDERDGLRALVYDLNRKPNARLVAAAKKLLKALDDDIATGSTTIDAEVELRRVLADMGAFR